MWYSVIILTIDVARAPWESCARDIFGSGNENVYAILAGHWRDIDPQTVAHCSHHVARLFPDFHSNVGPLVHGLRAMNELTSLFISR